MKSGSSDRELVADAGPVIALARLDLLTLSARIFAHVCITENVVEVFLAPGGEPIHRAIVKRMTGCSLRPRG